MFPGSLVFFFCYLLFVYFFPYNLVLAKKNKDLIFYSYLRETIPVKLIDRINLA